MFRLAKQALTYVRENSTPQASRFFLYLAVVVLAGLFAIVPWFAAESSPLQQSFGYARLAFTVQPSSTVSFLRIKPPVQVQVQDNLGNRISNASNSVTIAIGTNPAGGTLSGTLTETAVNGVATFANLSIDKPGVGYTLAASATGLTGATSSAFNILTGTTFHPGTVSLATMGASVIVRVRTGGVDQGVDGIQLNIQHSRDVTVTSPACVGIFQGASELGPTDIVGGTLIGCFLQPGNVSATEGDVMTFVVTRVATGNPSLTFGVGGASGTQFSDAGVTISAGITNTLLVTGAADLTGSVTLQGRTSHGIATVTSSSGGVTASVRATGSFTLPGVLLGTTLTASAPGYVSKERINVVVVDGSGVTVPAEHGVQLRCGLVNNDNFVDINDITATVASFGRTMTARVDALGRFVDQNGDGGVNINDITCVASNFGVTSPQPWP